MEQDLEIVVEHPSKGVFKYRLCAKDKHILWLPCSPLASQRQGRLFLLGYFFEVRLADRQGKE
ncbi:hypothetical protein SAMN02745225_00987 [Ferrithrix thermotolerans DSM 19514]|uniref:Uncharacterized protein n=1 Tax=Ferrithrix thermotolerans DSM 19514 TaxID=1121881 RepID=A0A1M4UHQ5_9ACTN|nr:hypothetical protein SAMN02745225_00987 [Ferrithrix thermotolerans DSM 19514]